MTEETLQAAEEAVIDSESAPEGEEAPENVEAPENQEDAQEAQDEGKEETPGWFQKAIDRQTYKYREEERRANKLAEELERIKAQSPQQDGPPDIPPPPDPFDDNYEEKIKERDKAVRARIEYDTRQALIEESNRRKAQQEAESQQKALMDRGTAYKQRAEKLGVEPNELATAGPFVASYIAPELGDYLLDSEQGPAITVHLAKNPQVLEQVAQMPPMMAAAHIATSIVPNLSAKPKQTKAPKPPETLGGGGAPPDDGGPAGATYE